MIVIARSDKSDPTIYPEKSPAVFPHNSQPNYSHHPGHLPTMKIALTLTYGSGPEKSQLSRLQLSE